MSQKELTGIRLLLVDDETVFLRSLEKVLLRRGSEVMTAERGEDALQLLATTPFDVVVLDLRMPGLGGIDTLKRIRDEHPATAVILLSGHADMSSAMEAMKLGAIDYLLKPTPVGLLCERIKAAMEKRSILNELGR